MVKDQVVLLHGIFRTRRSMGRLEQFLQRAGYATLNIGYPSRRYGLEQLAERIHPAIQALKAEGRLHFVGYSMGGLLVRAYICRFSLARLGRVVMLGTPNQGSEVADFYCDWRLYRWLYGPAGQQLITRYENAGELYGDVHYPLGVIAGNRNIDPISARLIQGENDGKVSVESTKLDGMHDHLVMPVSHTFLPARRMVHAQVLYFLREGRFQHTLK